MRRVVILVSVVGVLLVALWFGLSRSDKQGQHAANPSVSTPTNPTSDTTATNNVSIYNFAFSPANISVRKGTTVTWKNNDSADHTVTEIDGRVGPNSKTLKDGDSYSFSFIKSGQYHYRCSFHTDMVGTVTVTN